MTFELIISAEEKKAGTSFVTIWENDNGVTRMALEATEPQDTDTEYVGKAVTVAKFGGLHFGGLGSCPNGVKVTFDDSGAFRNAEAV